MAKPDYSWWLLGGGLLALYFGTRKAPPVDEAIDEDEAAPEGGSGPGPDIDWGTAIKAVDAVQGYDCLDGWSDDELRSLMENRETEITWTGEDQDEKGFVLTQLIVAELCAQLYQPESRADALSVTDPGFRDVWFRLEGIAWKVVRNWPE